MGKRTLLIHPRIITAASDTVIEDGILIFEKYEMEPVPLNDKITFVGEMRDLPDFNQDLNAGDVVVDMTGHTILPGLFNVHSHLGLSLPYKPYRFDEWGTAYRSLVHFRRAAEALNCGVTTIRSTGVPDGVDFALRDAVDRGVFFASRIVPCGALNIAVGGHSWNKMDSAQFNGPDAFRACARRELARGAAFIKIGLTGGAASAHEGMADKQMTDEEISAVVEVAHGAGKKVAAHLGGNKPILDALRLGVDSVEHGYSMTDETCEMIAKNHKYFVPTLSVTNCDDYLIAHGSPEYQVRKLRDQAVEHLESVGRAIKAGVKICTGTDLLPSDPIDGTNATVREVELLVMAGMSPMDAIKAATVNSAELCDLLDETGTLEAGKAGDIIAVAGCPDKNIRDLRNLQMVVRGCRLVWSTVPGLSYRNYNPVAPGLDLSGGTYLKW